MSSLYLKIKIMALASEARIIHREERKQVPWRWKHKQKEKQKPIRKPSDKAYENYYSLRNHRRFCVGPEQRAALLAYGFIRGLPYAKIESNPRWKRLCAGMSPETMKQFGHLVGGEYIPPNWNRVQEIAEKFAPMATISKAEIWAWANGETSSFEKERERSRNPTSCAA